MCPPTRDARDAVEEFARFERSFPIEVGLGEEGDSMRSPADLKTSRVNACFDT
jgi:hypothetical protein